METLLVERHEGVATVTMNRPEKKNAFNGVMLTELLEVFEEVERSTEDRVLVLTGAGGAFSSGADLSDTTGPLDPGLPGLRRMQRLAEPPLALYRLSKPAIAKVDGLAVGAGLSLALGCDLVVASESARFSAIFVRRGLTLDFGASWLLPRRIGVARAKELAFFGDMVSAAEALEFGLVNRVVPADQLDQVVGEWAARLAAGPALALASTKALLNNSLATSMDQALEDEGRCQAYNFTTEDTHEALRAFLQRREPRFGGR
jgi:2-(1,2-epoxy-1,2-dihydrophenyl)acetyl-CoA isomerase